MQPNRTPAKLCQLMSSDANLQWIPALSSKQVSKKKYNSHVKPARSVKMSYKYLMRWCNFAQRCSQTDSQLSGVNTGVTNHWNEVDWTLENVRNKLYRIAGLFRGRNFSRILRICLSSRKYYSRILDARAAPACACMFVPFRGCGYKKCLLDGQLQDVSPGNYKTSTWTGLWIGLNYGLAHWLQK